MALIVLADLESIGQAGGGRWSTAGEKQKLREDLLDLLAALRTSLGAVAAGGSAGVAKADPTVASAR